MTELFKFTLFIRRPHVMRKFHCYGPTFPECREGPGLGSNKPLLYPERQQQLSVEHTYWNLGHNELSLLSSDLRGLLPPWSQTGPSKRQKEANNTHCPSNIQARKWALQSTDITHTSKERCHKEERKLRTTNDFTATIFRLNLAIYQHLSFCH